MKTKKKIQSILFFSVFLILFYTYYYLPGKYSKVIKVEDSKITIIDKQEQKLNAKNTFTNTEYKSIDNKGQVFTTKAVESFIYQDKPDLIHLIDPHSFTKLEKDQSMIEIFSKRGLYDKNEKITNYNEKVVIKNKNYLITADSAKHFSKKNLIFLNGNIVMKDLSMGLSHIAYCDTVEINTLTNDVIAYMSSNYDKVIAKKFK